MRFKSFFLFIFLLGLLTFSAVGTLTASAFSDNFNDGDMSDWTITGSWSNPVIGYDGTAVARADTVGATATHTYSGTFPVQRIDMLYPNAATNVFFRFQQNSSGSYARIYYYAGTGRLTIDGSAGNPVAWSSNVVYTPGTWNNVQVAKVGNNYVITVRNSTNNSIMETATISQGIDIINADRVVLEVTGGTQGRFDNLVGSAVSSGATTTLGWDATTYIRDDTATFSWVFSDADWSSTDRFFFRLYKNNIMQDFGSYNWGCLCYTQFSPGSQTGNYSILANEPGNYRVTLEKGLLSYTLITDATVRVRDYSNSYLLINKSVPYKTSVPVNYGFGFGGINLNYAIQTYFFDVAKNEYQFEHSFFGLSSSGTRNIYFERTGTYIVKLRNVPLDKTYVQATTLATFAIPETPLYISTSTLQIDSTTYAYGETIFGNYTIDNTNYTAGVTYLDILNTNNQVATEFYGSGFSWKGVTAQTGELLINLLNSPATENFPGVTIFTGANQLRLMVSNASGNRTVIATANFTIGETTTSGYGLQLSKYEVNTKETFYAYVRTPEAGATLMVFDPSQTCAQTGQTNFTCGVLYNVELKNATRRQTIPLVISKEGTYTVALNNPAKDTEVMQNVKVLKAIVKPSPTPTLKPGESPVEVTTNAIDGWTAMFGIGVNWVSKLLFALVWTLLITFIGVVLGKGNGTTGAVTGFIPFAFFTAIGYFPYWFIVIGVIMIGLKIGWFK